MSWLPHLTSEIDAFKSQPAVRSLVMKHSGLRPSKTITAVSFDWAFIVATIAACEYGLENSESWVESVAIYAVTTLLIACRQHALLVIMHEAAHFRISKNQTLNDFIGGFLAAFPTMSTLTGYRKHHIQHHRTTNTDEDPDWARKLFLPDWQYPQTRLRIARVFSKQFYRGGWDWCLFMTKIAMGDRARLAFWFVVVCGAAASGYWKEFALYWMIPLWCVFPFIQRVRSTSEHFGLPNEHELNGTRNTIAGFVETFLFSPHEVNYHLTHHLFPSVPFYNLKQLHEELGRFETYKRLAYSNDSFWFGPRSVFADLQTKGTHPVTHTNGVEAGRQVGRAA